jgi:predicted O-methyltransferase YrrM
VQFHPFAVGNIPGATTSTSFWIGKSPELFDAWLALLDRHRGGAMVEVGIFEGGSAALCALTADPSRLVCVDIVTDLHPALAEMIEEQGLEDRVRIHPGVDQADRAVLATIVEREFGDQPLDLVVDDASHLYGPSVATFEVLFPRLRPGGAYVIEDWTWEIEFVDRFARLFVDEERRDEVATQFAAGIADPANPVAHLGRDMVAIARTARQRGREVPWGAVSVENVDAPAEPTRPLAHLIQQLVMSQATGRDEIAELHVNPGWVEVVRGRAPIDPGSFRVTDLYPDWYGLLGMGDPPSWGDVTRGRR